MVKISCGKSINSEENTTNKEIKNNICFKMITIKML